MEKEFSAIITKGKIAYVSYCPELGVASQGKTKKKALDNLKEAVELYLEEINNSYVMAIPKPEIKTFAIPC